MKTRACKGPAITFALALALTTQAENPAFAVTLLVDSLVISPKEKIIASGKAERFDRSSIFEYSDGGAEVYLDGGFATCLVRHYDFRGVLKRSLEIAAYDMTTSLKALGLFQTLAEGSTVSRSGTVETMSDIRREVLHKAALLVEIVDKSDSALPASTLAQTAAALSGLIQGGTAAPAEFSWLPEKGKAAGSERYYHRNFLSRSFLPCALTARYIVAAVPCTLFISRHDSASSARRDMQKLETSFNATHMADTLRAPALTAIVKGPYIIGIAGKAFGKNALDLIKSCSALAPEQ